jgi:hypothetical protein
MRRVVQYWRRAAGHEEYGKKSWGKDLTGLRNLSGLPQNAAILGHEALLAKAPQVYYNQLVMTEQENRELDVERIASFWLTEADEALQLADHLIAKADYS